ncbi:MAG: DUF6850 family outer membrane beta-barrel protein [Prolixibacteraceae bacterium]
MANLYPVLIDLGVDFKKGNFKPVYQGENKETYFLDSKSFQKINKTILFGEFGYRKSYERNLDFSNLNNPAMNQPYLLADTIGNDTYEREVFNLSGAISSPVNDNFDWGLKFDYKVGVAAQNRDPRPENKVLQLNLSPGLLWKLTKIKLGVNLNYNYYNEDIDISVVKENTEYAMFQLHGLGTSNYHVSSSFYRLYKQNKLGGGAQLSIETGNIENISIGSLSFLDQRVDDGRKASGANWATVKNDAKLVGFDYKFENITTLKKSGRINQLTLKFDMASRMGTEYIQRLEKTGETDLEQWITYGAEGKYFSKSVNLNAGYSLINLKANGQINSLINLKAISSSFLEKYYLPDLNLKYQNLRLEGSYLKAFLSGKNSVSAEIRMAYQTNISATENLMQNSFITDKILQPNFEFITADFIAPGASVSYEIPIKKINKYYIKTDFDWFRSNDGHSRTCLNFSTGIIF